MKKLNEKGQTLIEVLVALAAAVAVIVAITIIVVTSLSNVEFTKNQNLATEYSRQGLEILRQLAKESWTNFSSYTSINYCLAQGSSSPCVMGSVSCGTPTTCGQNVGIFVRQITIEQNSSSCSNNVKVTSTVKWSDSKCTTDPFCHSVILESCFANTNVIQGP